MVNKFRAKPIEVEAFQFGVDTQPLWFLQAIRKKLIHVMPVKGTIVAKTEDGKINLYDPKTFNALFETVTEAQDLNKDGIVDAREKAIDSEVKKKRAPRKKKAVNSKEVQVKIKPEKKVEE